MRQDIALFIGGPNDLTKQVLRKVVPFINVAEMPNMFANDVRIDPYAEPTQVVCHVHLYERQGRVETPHEVVHLYVHQGDRR